MRSDMNFPKIDRANSIIRNIIRHMAHGKRRIMLQFYGTKFIDFLTKSVLLSIEACTVHNLVMIEEISDD